MRRARADAYAMSRRPSGSTPGPVIVGVDGSPGSWAAVGLGAWEAKRRHLPLLLVYAYTEPVPYAGYGWGPYPPYPQSFRDDAREMLTGIEMRTRADHPGVQVRSTLVPGGGASALVELSRTASLVLVGSRGLGGFAGLLLGSVSTQVATHAHAPLIVVRTREGSPAEAGLSDPGPIVVGLDGSPHSAAALAFAAEEASARSVPLVAVYVWWALPKQLPSTSLTHDTVHGQEQAERMLAEALAGWSEKYPDLEVRRSVINDPSPQWRLIESSREAGLLVVGSRGRGGFASMLLGSVSRTVLNHAHCPVAVIRDWERDAERE